MAGPQSQQQQGQTSTGFVPSRAGQPVSPIKMPKRALKPKNPQQIQGNHVALSLKKTPFISTPLGRRLKFVTGMGGAVLGWYLFFFVIRHNSFSDSNEILAAVGCLIGAIMGAWFVFSK
jgi:hypothetical protein